MNDIVRARAEAMWAEDRASVGLGMRLDEVAPGRARVSMPIGEAMANGHGICHGGFIFALADSAMAFAANPRGEAAVAQHAAITFVRPGRVGEVLVAEAAERMHAGRSGMYDVRVRTEHGELIAEFRGHTRTIRARSGG
jgi:acyl-CoA thioesterase